MPDQLHKKPRQKKADDLTRKQAAREPYDKVLIVCEGSKTEPDYLKALIDHLKLATANVQVTNASGSDPMSVVEHAETLTIQSKKQKETGGYDWVFCVFDKDDHEQHGNKFSQAENKLTQLKHALAITSTPCFEVWPILHFECVNRPFSATKGKTAAKATAKYLKQYIPDYEKGNQTLFQAIYSKTHQAIVNAKSLKRQNKLSDSDNPSTNMHELVEYLQKLKHNGITKK